jgi:uncharacterized repeat protein (TIGR01451 family)
LIINFLRLVKVGEFTKIIIAVCSSSTPSSQHQSVKLVGSNLQVMQDQDISTYKKYDTTCATRRLGWLVSLMLCVCGAARAQPGGWLHLYGPQWFANQVVADGQGRYFVAGSNIESDGRRWAFVQRLNADGDTIWNLPVRPVSKATGLIFTDNNGALGVLTRTLGIDVDSIDYQQVSNIGTLSGAPFFVAERGKTLVFPPNELHATTVSGWVTANSPLGIEAGPTVVYDKTFLTLKYDTLHQASLFDMGLDPASGDRMLALWKQIPNVGYRPVIQRRTADGVVVWEQVLSKFEARYGRLVQTTTGDWVAYLRTANDGRLYRLKADDGQLLDTLQQSGIWGELGLLAADPAGSGYFLCDQTFAAPNRIQIQRFDADGLLIGMLEVAIPGYEDRSLFVRTCLPLAAGGFLLSGQISTDLSTGATQSFLAKIDAEGRIFRHILAVEAYDAAVDCAGTPSASGGIPYSKFVVQQVGQPDAALYVADAEGRIYRDANAGTYHVQSIMPNPTWAACTPINNVSVSGIPNDTTWLYVPMQPVTRCPYLTVDIGTPELRCGLNTYFVQYCNAGTGVATDAFLDVTVDDALSFGSSQQAYQAIDNQHIRFYLGDLEPGHCGTFSWSARLACAPDEPANTSRTHCVEAHIYPDTFCVVRPGWTGARLAVQGACVGDSLVRFIIRNIGNGPTSGAVEYIVIEDIVIRESGSSAWPPLGKLWLDAGDSIIVTVPANGHTWSIQVEQDSLYPGAPTTLSTVTGCGGESGLADFRVAYDDGDQPPSVAVECRQFGAAGKLAFPAGTDADNCLEPGREVEYVVVFRNESNVVANRVVIRDTLSQLFDLQSIVPGVTSHPARLDLESSARLIRWTLDSLYLLPASVSDSASIGFVRFRVRLPDSIASGTLLTNHAWVQFEGQAPIKTTSVVHTIQPVCLQKTPLIQPTAACLRAAPNPVFAGEQVRLLDTCSDYAVGLTAGTEVQITDAVGRVVVSAPRLEAGGRLVIPNWLTTGVYIIYLPATDNTPAVAVRLVVI